MRTNFIQEQDCKWNCQSCSSESRPSKARTREVETLVQEPKVEQHPLSTMSTRQRKYLMYCIFSCSEAPRSRQTITVPGLDLPSFYRISTEKTFKFNKKTGVYKLPRGAIYKPPCMQLINNPFFAIHQVFALSINAVQKHYRNQSAAEPTELQSQNMIKLNSLCLFWMHLFYLQLRSFYLRFVFFTYGGGTVSKKDQIQFPDGGEP